MNPIRRRRLGGKNYPMQAAQFAAAATQNLFIADASQVGLNPDVSDFAVQFWAKPASAAGLMNVFGKGAIANTATLAPGYSIALSAATLRLTANFCDNTHSTVIIYTATTSAPAVGAWSHCVLNFSRAGNVQGFVNNVAQNVLDISPRNGSCTPAANFAIGSTCRNDTNAYSAYFDGTLDMVGFWLRTLSLTEIALLYNGGLGMAGRDLPAGLKTSLSGWWDFDSSFLSLTNVNNLAAGSAAPTFGPGKR